MSFFKIRSPVEASFKLYEKSSTVGNFVDYRDSEKGSVTEDDGQLRQVSMQKLIEKCRLTPLTLSHSQPILESIKTKVVSEYKLKEEYDLSKSDDAFIAGHNIDGRVIFPSAGFLFLIWRAIAKANRKTIEETIVILENILFHKAVYEPKNNRFGFEVNIQRTRDEFEVFCDNDIAVTGSFIVLIDRKSDKFLLDSTLYETLEDKKLQLTSDDVYAEFKQRGYHYNGIFKGISSSDLQIQNGSGNWNNNWTSFIDTMLQFNNIASTTRGLYLPSKIKRVFIDPLTHHQNIIKNTVLLQNNRNINVTRAGGIEIQGLEWNLQTVCDSSHQMPIIQKMVFIPYNNSQDNEISAEEALIASLQIVIENMKEPNLDFIELTTSDDIDSLLLPNIKEILTRDPLVKINATLVLENDLTEFLNAVKKLNLQIKQLEDIRAMVLEKNNSLILGTNVISKTDDKKFKKLTSLLSDHGMMLIKEPLEEEEYHTRLLNLCENANLVIISQQITNNNKYILLHKKKVIPEEHCIIEIANDDKFMWLNKFSEAIKRFENKDARIYLVSYSCENDLVRLFNYLQGKTKVNLRAYFLPDATESFDCDKVIYKKQIERDLSVNILKNREWGCYSYLTIQDSENYQEVENAFITASTSESESFTSFRWVEGTPRNTELSDKELCHVYFTALNECDLMQAKQIYEEGLYRNEYTLGIEFSGRTSKGKRVMGIVSSRGLATTVLADKNFLWEVPDNWSLERAATVPLAYATAYYALIVRGKMTSKDSVLIHRGASHVGQAAINLALHAGCEVFATVDSIHKYEFLLSRFYDLKSSNVAFSFNPAFEQMVLQCTNGRGVDLVLNHFEDNMITSSLRCLTNTGRCLNLGNMSNCCKTQDVLPMCANKTLHSIQMDAITDTEKQMVTQLMREGIAYGSVHAFASTEFPSEQLKHALKYMAENMNICKVLIRIKSEEPNGVKAEISTIPALRRTYMHPQKCYVIIGDQSSFSLEFAQWLTERGALKLALYSNNDVLSTRQSWYTRRWREKGATVVAKTNVRTSKEEAQNLLNEADVLGPIGGIFIFPTKTQQKFLTDITKKDLDNMGKSRVEVVKYLDEVSRALAPDLDYFVEFSSIDSGSGCSDNINSGIAPCAVTRLMEKRKEDRLPGLAIQWEFIDEFETEGDNIQTNETSVRILSQSMKCCKKSLDQLMLQNHTGVAGYLVAKFPRLKSRRSFLAAVNTVEDDPILAKSSLWGKAFPVTESFIPQRGVLPPGGDLQWPVSKSLSQLRSH